MDMGLPNDASGIPREFLDGISYLYSNPQLPIALQVVGAAFLTGGWDVNCLESKLFRKNHPSFLVKKGDRTYLLFVDTKGESFSNRESISAKVPQIESVSSGEEGMRCLQITVHLDSVEDGFNVRVDGLHELIDEISPITFVRKPELIEPASMGEELNKAENYFDEALVAEKYLRCLNEGDLSGLSRVLVEDVYYINAPSKVIIRGRHDLLSFLGRHISGERENTQKLVFRTGAGILEGVTRHFVFTYIEGQKEPRGCTCFMSGKSRNGHVSLIRCVYPSDLESCQLSEVM
jgi:hypothetical protein